jgi:3,2-trans-enoyl-CoA isomerase
MEFLKTVVEEHVMHVQMDHGTSNAMHAPMVHELLEVVAKTQQDPSIYGLVLHGKPNYFCSGLDLFALYDYNELEIRSFWHDYLSLITSILSLNKPVIAAISGHSSAGGCLLAMAADYRLMAEGEFVIGLNELPVGIIVPTCVMDLYSHYVGSAKAYQYLLEGKLFSPQQALQIGLVDELVPANRIITQAERKMRNFLQFEPNSWKETKRNLRQPMVQRFKAIPEAQIEAMLAHWWSPSARQLLKIMVDKLNSTKNN